jgi:Tol biopolymer transport system component
VDLEGPAVLEAPRPVSSRFLGSNRLPDWSPDGKYLAYQSNRPGADLVIVIRSVETGAERELRAVPPVDFTTPRWSASGDAILVSGTLTGKKGIYRIDPQTGAVTLVVELPSDRILFTPAWSREQLRRYSDGSTTSTAFSAWMSPPGSFRPCTIPRTHQDRSLLATPDLATRFSHRMAANLLFQQRDRPRSDNLLLMPPEGGTPRVLLSGRWPEQALLVGAYAWTPDSCRILITQRAGAQFEIFVIPAEGSTPRRTGIRMNGIRFLRLHPDGRRIAFEGGQADARSGSSTTCFEGTGTPNLPET